MLASVSLAKGFWGSLSPSVVILGGGPSLRKFLGCRKYLDWLKIDLNVAEIVTV